MQATERKERGILFSGEEVRAILDGRKTMTRRVIRAQPPDKWDCCERIDTKEVRGLAWCFYSSADRHDYGYLKQKCPFRVGQILWVRETWQLWDIDPGVSDLYDVELIDQPLSTFRRSYFRETQVVYRASRDNDERWRPSIFMPRWASRITLEVTGVRVERVKAITEEDAIAEGIEFRGGFWLGGIHPVKGTMQCWPFARLAFERLWDSFNAKRGYSWESNPWVWVVEFKRVREDGDTSLIQEGSPTRHE